MAEQTAVNRQGAGSSPAFAVRRDSDNGSLPSFQVGHVGFESPISLWWLWYTGQNAWT